MRDPYFCCQSSARDEGTDLFDIDLRVKALAAFAQTDTAEHLAAANKRVANILAKADSLDGTGLMRICSPRLKRLRYFGQ